MLIVKHLVFEQFEMCFYQESEIKAHHELQQLSLMEYIFCSFLSVLDDIEESKMLVVTVIAN